MKKETLLEIILGCFGGLSAFALGMRMILMPECKWNMLKSEIAVGAIGFIVLLSEIPVCKSRRLKKIRKTINRAGVFSVIIGIIGALILGFGMSKVMIGEPRGNELIIGIASGIAGLIICALNYPIYSYFKNNAIFLRKFNFRRRLDG